jgi:serine/threonine protein kinase
MSSLPTEDSTDLGEADEARFPDVGETFEGKYRIEGLLGRGGYAKVYRATQLELERDVAIKVLSPNVQNIEASESNSGSVEALALRFEREAKLVSQLRSPYTVTMHDYGRTDEDLLYMVLEYIDGITLDDAEVPMEPERISKILRQVLKSLHEAHDRGLLHRDLKPANIMLYEHLGEQDQAKLLDFGIAKLIGERNADRARNEADITGDATLLGTPRYMAPEQIRGDEVGPTRDIYSLGLIAYEMLVGRKAITEDDSVKIMAKHISDEPLRASPEECDPDLARIINEMLAKRPEERYQSVRDVIDDLQAYERGEQLQAAPDSAGPDSAAHEGGEVDPAEPTSDSSRVGLFLAVVVAVLLLAGVGTVLLLQYRGGWEETKQALGVSETDETDETGESDEVDPSATPTDRRPGMAAGAVGADTGDSGPEDAASTDTAAGDSDAGMTLHVTSSPDGATITVEGRDLGETPLDVDAFGFDYPVTVTARYGSREDEQTLDEPLESLDFELDRPTGGAAPSGTAQPSGADRGPSPSPGSSPPDRPQPAGSSESEPSEPPSDPEQQPQETDSDSPDSPEPDKSSDDSSDSSESSEDETEYLPIE